MEPESKSGVRMTRAQNGSCVFHREGGRWIQTSVCPDEGSKPCPHIPNAFQNGVLKDASLAEKPFLDSFRLIDPEFNFAPSDTLELACGGMNATSSEVIYTPASGRSTLWELKFFKGAPRITAKLTESRAEARATLLQNGACRFHREGGRWIQTEFCPDEGSKPCPHIPNAFENGELKNPNLAEAPFLASFRQFDSAFVFAASDVLELACGGMNATSSLVTYSPQSGSQSQWELRYSGGIPRITAKLS